MKHRSRPDRLSPTSQGKSIVTLGNMAKRGLLNYAYNYREVCLKKNKGLALPFVLLVLTLLLVAVSAVAHQGLGTLQQAKLTEFSKQAAYAAEAGVADALEQLVDDQSLDGPLLPKVEMAVGASYIPTIYNNFSGGASISAPNGAEIPAGYAYILSEGELGTIKRRVGVLVSPGAASALGIAIGVGGQVDMSGSKRVTGSVKANGNIDFGGSTRIEPSDGSGRLLSSGSISVSGSTRVDDTQDVLARSGISGSIRGGNEVNGSDSTVATEPFINDYRTNNSTAAGEKGSVLPNPDPAALLTGAEVHDTGGLPFTTDIDLDGKVHFFPYGVDFSGSTNITGPGTIVSGGGYPIKMSGSTRVVDVNLVAIRDGFGGLPTVPGNDASIRLSGSSRVSGLVYAHHGIDVSGSFRLTGLLISYDPILGNLDTSGSTRVTLDSTVLSKIPGFEPWANGFGGTGGAPTSSIGVVSWERL
jgi:hypothetical protein